MDAFTLIQTHLPLGATVQGGKATVIDHNRNGATLQRASGSTVRVTARKVGTVLARLQAGEAIPFRAIDYTSTIEAGIVAALGSLITVNAADKQYTLGA